MPPIDNRAPAPAAAALNLDKTLTQAQWIAGDDQKNKVVLLGADGKLEVHSLPTRTPPNRWTHFKAAFVRVPLIGRLRSVQQAAHLIEATNFRNSFRAAVAQRFGELAASGLSATVGAGDKATIGPKKIIKMLGTAKQVAEMTGRQNGEALLRDSADDAPGSATHTVGRYARMMATAQEPDYFRKHLDDGERTAFRQAARGRLQAMCGPAGSSSGAPELDALPPTFRKVLESYENRLTYASIEAQPAIAAECLEALHNLTTIALAHTDADGSSDLAPAIPLNEPNMSIASQLCAHAAGPQGRRHEPQVAQRAWADLRDTYEKLCREVPDMPQEAVWQAMRDVTSGKTSISPRELHRMTREKLLINEMKRLFDPRDAESTLWNAVMLATKDHPAAMNAHMTAMVEMLAKKIMLDLEFRAPVLHEHFGCEDHLPTVMEKTREKLIENTVAAAVGHLNALQQIEESTTLSPSQKEVFRNYAKGGDGQPPRRLDPVQVKQMIAIADPMAQRAGGERDPALLFDNMIKSQDAFQNGVREILLHAETMWISRSLDGVDSEQRLTELAVRLLIARLKDNAAAAGSPSSSEPEEPSEQVKTSIQQFMFACNQGSSMQIAKLAQLLGDMLRVFKSPLLQSDGDVVGPKPTLNQLPPDLLVRTLAHPSGRADGGSLDQRGVLVESPNGSTVARDFNPDTIANPDRHQAKLEQSRADGGDRMPVALNRALAGADVIVQGQRLTRSPASAPGRLGNEPATVAFDNFLRTVPPDVVPAINTCISSHALRDFVADVNAAAFGPAVNMANSRGTHEIWQDNDGSWLVRSTHVSSPLALAGKPIHTDGVILYTLTHRITPSQDGGDPRIELSDSNVVFAF